MSEDAKIQANLGKGFAPDSIVIESLHRVAINPITIRKIFLLLTRVHYSDADNYGAYKPQLSNFVWSKDPAIVKLYIDFDYNYDPLKMDRRPAIYVGTSDIDFKQVVVDNSKNMSEDRSAEEYVKEASTNIIIRHIGKTPDESWALGDLSLQYYLGIRKMLQERLKVSKLEVIKLMASKPFERTTQQADQQFIVDLLVNLQYNAAWLTMREGHRIKTVTYAQSLADFAIDK
jgi:hypothetical protein